MNDHGHGRFAACGLALVALALSGQTGCSKSAPPTAERAVADRVEITVVDRAEFDAVRERLAGQVVLVDCWATWCLPCVEQLPHTMELARRHEADGLVVVTLSFDDPEAAPQVRQALAGAGDAAASTLYLQSEFGVSPQSMDAFDVASGSLPHYKLYDRAGALRRTFELDPSAERQFRTVDVDAAVAELLAE